ncbi:hypothetical protein FACS189413_08430 [Bacteroidia bacterium]|nr:hypothetical protein FACS189413_08430 [Bacteroidia bacterium]
MAIPIRSVPVLEGKVAERFERERIKAEKKRGSIDITENVKIFNKMRDEARSRGIYIG